MLVRYYSGDAGTPVGTVAAHRRTATRRTDFVASPPWILALIVLVVAFCGCSESIELADGSSIEVTGTIWYWGRWVAALCVAGIALFIPLMMLVVHFSERGVDTLGWLLGVGLAVAGAGGAYCIYPGDRDPTERAQTLPAGQQRAAQELKTKLESQLGDSLRPMLSKYQALDSDLEGRLTAQFAKANPASHEELLRRATESVGYATLKNSIEEVALTRNALAWLQAKISRQDVNIEELRSRIARLQVHIDISSVATAEEQKEVEAVLSRASALLEEKQPVPVQQDVAKLSEKIFAELAAGAAR